MMRGRQGTANDRDSTNTKYVQRRGECACSLMSGRQGTTNDRDRQTVQRPNMYKGEEV